jgi:hypothetical protein
MATGNLSFNHEDHFLSLIISDPSLVFERQSDYLFLYWGIAVVIILLVFGLIKSGARLLFRVHFKNRVISTVTTIVSVLATCAIIYGGIQLGKNFSKDETVLQTIPINSFVREITLQVNKDNYFSDKLLADDAGFEELVKIKGQRIVFGYPEVDIRRCATGGPRIEIEKTAHGARRMDAVRNAENVFYPVSITHDSVLTFQPVFTSPLTNKFRAQQVKVRLYLPDSTLVHLQSGMYRVLRLESCDTQESVWMESPYSLRTFIMEEEGLRAVK